MLNRFSKTASPPAVDNPAEAHPAAIDGNRYDPRPSEIFNKVRRVLFNRYTAILLVIAVLAFTLSYQFKPAIYVNLGGGYDQPYLDKFAGEVRPEREQPQSTDITDTETRPATTEKADPAIVLDRNGKRVPEPVNDNYRWTTARSIVLLPGIGAYPGKLTIRAGASPLYPQGQQVQVLLNGQNFATFTVKPGIPQTFDFQYRSESFQNGNMAVELRISTTGAKDPAYFWDNKSYYVDGLKLYDLWMAPQGGAFILPDPKTSLTLVAACLFLFFLLGYSGVSQLWSFGISTAFTIILAVILSVWRLELAVFATRLALIMVVTGVALLVFDLLVPRLFRKWELPLSPHSWKWLMVLFVAGMLLRGGGTLYPQTVVIDAPWHLNVINRILDEPGGVQYEYFSKEASKVPAHWGSAAVIPYSPFTHFYFAPFAALPIERGVTVNLISIFLDASRVLVIYALALALGTGARAALVGAGLYLMIPSTYLLNSWGNWPTTVSLWLAALYMTLVLVNYRKLNRPGVFAGVTVLLIITNLAYSVTMVFMGMVLYAWAAGLFFVVGRKDRFAKRNGLLVFASATLAALCAIAVYYWQFIGDIIPTIQSFGQDFDEGKGIGLGERSFFEYLGIYADNVMINYGIGVFILMALITAVLALRKKPTLLGDGAPKLGSAARNWYIWTMFGHFFLWGIAQWKVDMVDKHVWFIVPLVVTLAGPVVLFLWEKAGSLAHNVSSTAVYRWAGRLTVSLIFVWISYSAISLWIYRIFFKRH